MRTALCLATLALAVVGGWWSLDMLVLDAVREQIALRELGGQLALGRVELDLPRRARVFDVVMRDAADGHDVVQLEQVDFDVALNWDDGLGTRLISVNGLGGRLSIVPTADGLGSMVETLIDVIRAIVELVAERAASDARGALPPLLFRDIDVVLLADSWPVESYPGSRVLVVQNGDAVEATVDFGGGGGRLVLRFGVHGLDRLVTEDLILTPAIVRLIGEPWGPLLARLARPQGRADLVISELGQSLPDVRGVVREVVIDSPWVPFPLGPLTLPLDLSAGKLSVATEPWPFENGTMTAQLVGGEEALELSITVRDAALREAYLGLVPVYAEQDAVHCADGGQFDLDLLLSWNFEAGLLPTVSGRGGFHVQTIEIPAAGLTLDDVVGRLEVIDERLSVPEVTGLCVGGGFSGSGSLDLVDNRFTLELLLKDLNLARLQAGLVPEIAAASPVAGWVAGRLSCDGDVDRLDLVQGQGELSIRAGRFAESQLLTAIRDALTLGPAERRNDQRLQAELSLWNGILTFDRISVDLGLLALTGQGQLDRDAELNLALLLMREPDGLLGSMWGFVQRNLICEVQVTGPFDQVEVAVYPLGVISRPLQAAIDFLSIWRDEDP